LLKYLALHLTIRFFLIRPNWLQIITKTNKNKEKRRNKKKYIFKEIVRLYKLSLEGFNSKAK